MLMFSQTYWGPKDVIYNSTEFNFDFDLNAAEKKALSNAKKIFISIYIIDTTKIRAYNCLPYYNFELFDIKFNNYVEVESSQIFINLKKDNAKFKTISSLRSTLFLYCKDDSIQSLIKANLGFLSLGELYDNNNGVRFYKIENIGEQAMFCWKLNQILTFFENHKEILQKKEQALANDKNIEQGLSVNVNSSVLISNKFAASNNSYTNSITANTSAFIFGFDVQFVKKNYSVGLGLFHSRFNLNNSIENSVYTLDWSNNNLSGINSKNIYYNDVKEEIIFSNYNIVLPFSYLINFSKPNSLFLDINSRIFYSFPFTMKSKLVSGDLSYRGKMEAINDELINIPSLGFIENDQSLVGKESSIKMHGYGFNIGANICYNFHSFITKFGVSYYYLNYRNLQYDPDSSISKQINDYNSSFFGVKNISSNTFAFHLGVGYLIK